MVVSPRLPPEHRPLFQKQLTNQCLHLGGTAYFECKVDGYPPPEILWTRRGHPLVDKARLVDRAIDVKRHFLCFFCKIIKKHVFKKIFNV